jgi:hypothetical protein
MKRLKWKYLNPKHFLAKDFGLIELIAVKVAEWKSNNEFDDIRCFSISGWNTIASLEEVDPTTYLKLRESKWFIFAGKGE